MDELRAAHRKQQRDLQSRIAQKRKNATKKTRKGVDDECAGLERALAAKQQAELDALAAPADDAEEARAEAQPAVDGEPKDSGEPKDVPAPSAANADAIAAPKQAMNEPSAKRPGRQKARLARRAAEQEAAAAQAAEEAANMPDEREAERRRMATELETRGLVEREVRSDGHCLYAAVADQLSQAQLPLQTDGLPDYKAVRRDAAGFMEGHPDDFAPFLEEPLPQYVAKVRDTAEWGGQLELSALARQYGICIQVLQGDGRLETISCPDEPQKEIWLAYYRHHFGLGEHYNSLRKAV